LNEGFVNDFHPLCLQAFFEVGVPETTGAGTCAVPFTVMAETSAEP
jgi:hypothetical protein